MRYLQACPRQKPSEHVCLCPSAEEVAAESGKRGKAACAVCHRYLPGRAGCSWKGITPFYILPLLPVSDCPGADGLLALRTRSWVLCHLSNIQDALHRFTRHNSGACWELPPDIFRESLQLQISVLCPTPHPAAHSP